MSTKQQVPDLPDDEVISLDEDVSLDEHLVDDLEHDVVDSAKLAGPLFVSRAPKPSKKLVIDVNSDDPDLEAAVEEIAAEDTDDDDDIAGIYDDEHIDLDDQDVIDDIIGEDDGVSKILNDNSSPVGPGSSAAKLSEDDNVDASSELDTVSNQKGIKGFLISLWKNPRRRWSIILILFVATVVLLAVPDSRYFILNTARVRASVELSVVDSDTLQPLKNMSVRVANVEAKTDANGVVKLEGVKLGSSQLKIEKRAFAAIDQDLIVGLGSNPLGEFKAKPVGSQYVFYVTELMSGQAIVKAEAVSGEASALSDAEGKVVLVVDTAELEDSATVDIDILAAGYRLEKLSLMANNKESQSVQMVSEKPHVFVSKRSGVYDVYAIDIDGKNERKIVSGSGFERNDITLVSNTSKNKVAYIATRENIRNSNGYLLSTLYLVDVSTKDIVKVDQSERIKIIGWTTGGRLAYVKMSAGGSGPMSDRHVLMSVNAEDYSEKTVELADSNYFNDVIMIGDTVYYALSNFYNEESKPGVYAVKVSGGSSKSIVDEEVYSIVRTSYDTLHLSTGSQWYEYVVGSPMAGRVNPPSSQDSKMYIDGANDKFSLWIDNRDGKGVLLSYDKATDHEKQLTALAGVRYPVYWLDPDTAVYRVVGGRETADYVISTKGGEPRKIVDVTDSAGIATWNYY